MKSARTVITICLLHTATLFAQTAPSQWLMKVNVPFSFGVEGHSLPAGEYLVFTVTPERSIRIVSADGNHSAIVNTLPNYASSPSVNSRKVFHRYGDDYYLIQVWTVGENVVRNPLPGKKEQEVPSNSRQPETFTVISLGEGRR